MAGLDPAIPEIPRSSPGMTIKGAPRFERNRQMTLEEVTRRLELEELYTDYAHCLDNDALEAWPEFFVEACYYRITSAENFEAGLPIGIVYATSRAMLADRVMALRKANIYEPQRYRHLVSNLKIAV